MKKPRIVMMRARSLGTRYMVIGESANARASTSAVTRICSYSIGVTATSGTRGSVRAAPIDP